jgi:1-aminocyclopropane-1-carboxylate deaminase
MQPDLSAYLHPSPVMAYDLFEGITFHVKRDDLVHPQISGNKWRKLKYNVLKAYESGCNTLLTFGGAFSNHLLATAKAAQLAGFNSIGIVRGEHADEQNSTLSEAVHCGMQLIKVPVSEYNERNNYHYLDQLRLEFPDAWIVPEGGANYEGVLGCTEILKEIGEHYDVITCAVGTGTTAAGLILSNQTPARIACFSVFKETGRLRSMIEGQMGLVLNDKETLTDYQNDMEIIEGYHFGGYARVNDTLRTFAREIYQRYALPLDLVYTAKLLYGISDLVQEGHFPKGSRILMYHSGGLQGNKGFDFNLE